MEDTVMSNRTSELKKLLDLFDKEGLVVSYLEADYFKHTFTVSGYPEKITTLEKFMEFIRNETACPLSADLVKAIENAGYKVVLYTSKHEPGDRNPGFFLLSIEKIPEKRFKNQRYSSQER
ncbi:MAG: hypothetical protein LBJ31_06070 [Treponema sp.]|nr:hypothetical protein [Treponema sp.]